MRHWKVDTGMLRPWVFVEQPLIDTNNIIDNVQSRDRDFTKFLNNVTELA